MKSNEAWLRLIATEGLGGESQRKLLAAFGLPEQIFSASLSNVRAVLGDKAKLLFQAPNDALIQQALTWAEQPQHHLVTLDDDRYPQQLLNIADPPNLLFVRGDLTLLQRPAMAIVGSRHASGAGQETARGFAKALGDAGVTVVSGLASGIDAAAHQGAVATSGKTIAVIGTGPDRLYPASNRKLAQDILETGCIVSEYFPGTPALPANFPRRNRIIAGLSRGVLVVEAALESGSLITARLALENGRDVMAVPGSIHSPLSKGCHRLIKQGAKLVETAEDILEEIGIPTSNPSSKSVVETRSAPETLQPIYALIEWQPIPFDVLIEKSGQPAGDVLTALLELEMLGLIAVLPGDLYQRRR